MDIKAFSEHGLASFRQIRRKAVTKGSSNGPSAFNPGGRDLKLYRMKSEGEGSVKIREAVRGHDNGHACRTLTRDILIPKNLFSSADI